MTRFLYFLVIVSLVSCSDIKMSRPLQETKKQSIFDGPITFSTEKGFLSVDKNSSQFLSLPINELLWRSTLDTLEFMSFEKIDPFSGIIITSWFINESTSETRNKITVSFYSSELKANSIKVSVTREIYKDKGWVSDGYSDGLARKVENLILSRARELRNNNQI